MTAVFCLLPADYGKVANLQPSFGVTGIFSSDSFSHVRQRLNQLRCWSAAKRKSLPQRFIQLSIGGLFALSLQALATTKTPDISLNGGTNLLRDNVRQYLTIADESCAAPLWRLKALLGDAQDEIEQAAQALGFYQLTFTSKLTQKNDCWQLLIELTPGEQTRVKEYRLVINGEGIDDEIFKPLMDNPDIKAGDGLHHGKYESIKSRLTTLAASHGYFDARFEVANITVNKADNSAVIELIYNTGQRYRFGEIRMKHNILAEDFLRRYLNFTSNEPYDADKLLELKSLYNATNYFSVATASPDLQNMHDGQVDINVQLEKQKRYVYSQGIGLSTDTGPRLLFGVEDRYVNEDGQNVKADVSLARVKKNAQITYTIPLRNPSYEFLKFYTTYVKEDTDKLHSEKNGLGTSYTYYQQNHWLHTYAVDLENETSAINGEPLHHSYLIIPSVTFSRTQTDGSPYPLAGWNLLAKLSGSPQTLGSDESFEQFYARGKYIFSAGYGRFLLRSELGITGVNNFSQLPASVRYFAGGDNSVRGYDYKSLGPKNDNNDVIGGNNLWVNSVEYDIRFKQNWAVAAFFDAGNAADDFNLHFKRGAGLGLRWISPIGPVRIDVARGLDEPKGWNLHVSMGPDL